MRAKGTILFLWALAIPGSLSVWGAAPASDSKKLEVTQLVLTAP